LVSGAISARGYAAAGIPMDLPAYNNPQVVFAGRNGEKNR
jgi:hypothetical protein